MQMKVNKIDSGMAIEMIRVDVNERRKRRITRKASTEPWSASCQRLWIACRM